VASPRLWRIRGGLPVQRIADTGGTHAKRECKNPPRAKIGRTTLAKTEEREYTPLVVEVNSAKQANCLISKGMAMAYNLKIVERYDLKCRITQCFKC
jgi:hypothetical protein